jgi:16S rRNA G966 N2-methylase RsmD
MNNLFQQLPEFISTDPRVNRPTPYAVDADFMHKRHSIFFNMALKNKKVLDLGSCVGATGAWVLSHGASYYCGVELDTNLASISEQNLRRYFPDSWDIVNMDVEKYLSRGNLQYDIIIASGIIFSLFDPIPFLHTIASMSDCLIIDSVHPKCFKDAIITDELIENAPLISFRVDQAMTWQQNTINYPASNPGLGFLKYYLEILGFEYQSSCYDQLKQECPSLYHSRERYGCRFVRTSTPRTTGFVNTLNANLKTTTQR